jgi:valyl-tRNA synthetase
VLVQTQISLGKWSRRFSADNIKQVTRPLAKMVAGNGLVVFEHLVTMAKNNDNMIEPLSKAIETSHPLALDMFAYTIVRILSDLSPKEQKLDAESNVAQWLTNIAQMAGMFFKKYPQTDIVPLLRYLLNKMRKDQDFVEMIVLQRVVEEMYGWCMFDIE